MPKLLFGGGTIGKGAFSTAKETDTLLDVLKASEINYIDTAAVYPPSDPGMSERLIGATRAGEQGFTIDTKIKVTGQGPGEGSLRRAAIDESVAKSLKVLNVDQVRC